MPVKYDREIMKLFVELDKFLQIQMHRVTGSEAEKLVTLFNTYVVGDSAMEKKYSSLEKPKEVKNKSLE